MVEQPTHAWFRAVERLGRIQVVRMAFMDDGRFLFGDGYHVVHHDMKACELNGAAPLFVTVFVKEDSGWKHGLVEQWCGSGDKSSVKERFHALCRRTIDWSSVCEAMGNDPMENGYEGAL